MEKRNKMLAAVTVNVILLIAVLVAVVIYQLITIVVISNRRKSLQEDIKRYEQLIEDSEDELAYLQSEQYLLDLALQYGYTFNGN